jgi:hypothetical protein
MTADPQNRRELAEAWGTVLHYADISIGQRLSGPIPDKYRQAVETVRAALLRQQGEGREHCDTCGLTWLDDGLNPAWCPYCRLAEIQVRYEAGQPSEGREPDGWYDPHATTSPGALAVYESRVNNDCIPVYFGAALLRQPSETCHVCEAGGASGVREGAGTTQKEVAK